MPAVSQVSTLPVGLAGKRQARQAVGSKLRRLAVRRAGKNVHRRGVGADCGGVDPWAAVAHAEIVDEIARLEVVGAVEDNVGIGDERLGVARGEIRDLRGDI